MNLHQLSVRGMLIGMTGFVLLAMLALAGSSLRNTQRLDGALLQVGDTAQAIRRQMDADMMHDAIRSDVLAALLAVREGRVLEIPEIQRDLVAHGERLKLNIAINAKADLGEAVRAQTAATQPRLNLYIDAARQVVAATVRGGQVDARKVAEFEKDFAALEIEMEKLSDLIQRDVEDARKDAHARVSGSKLNTVFILLLSIVAFGLFARFVFGRVVHPLAALASTAQNIRDSGDLTLRAPETENNEIGHSIQAFNALIEKLQAIVRDVRGNSDLIHHASRTLTSTAQDGAIHTAMQARDLAQLADALESSVSRFKV